MTLTNTALWVIERNLARPLTLTQIAQACGVSIDDLAHAFGAATGLSVMQYVRARRLTMAAQTLADGAPDILDPPLTSATAHTRPFREPFVHNSAPLPRWFGAKRARRTYQ